MPWRAEDIISCNNISPRICCTTCNALSWSYLVKISGIVSERKEKSTSQVLSNNYKEYQMANKVLEMKIHLTDHKGQ